ncbi:CoA pyrophosphatase [Marinibacterium sp. SX1]|uniref:CoA pyrophosphatase n=1 Tax=Marinibacterium sp. SX1 TaxID=3388424 RepID=UPI003D169B2F
MRALEDRIADALGRGGDPSSDFDLNPEVSLPPGRKLRPAGVLVGIDITGDAPRVLLTKRSSRLKHHPGQIAFPGGKQDDGDADVVDAALREAEEEVALPREAVRVMGTMPAHETVTGFVVTPVVALIETPFTIRPEPGEVEEAFAVPLDHLLQPDLYSIQSRRWRGNRRYYFTVPYGPYYIWGATARMLRAFAERMRAA